MTNYKPHLATAFSLVFLSACSQEVPHATPEPNPAAPELKATAPPIPSAVYFYENSRPSPIGNEVFSASPGMICNTNDSPIETNVKWDVSSMGISAISVHAISPDGERKLWINGGANEEARTGKWIYPGTKLILSDYTTERKLSEITIGLTECQKEDQPEISPQ